MGTSQALNVQGADDKTVADQTQTEANEAQAARKRRKLRSNGG